ncbi:MAG: serine hydrolase [Filimonas sp.]|nr:serine hydrolase [Filimonas sp.]
MKKRTSILRRILYIVLFIVLVGLGYGIAYCWRSFPIISGYGAKVLCSGVFVAGRDEQQVRTQDIGFFPISLGSFKVDYKDSSVTASVFGFAKRKAIFRKGLGVTLIAQMSEEEIRKQQVNLPQQPIINQDSIAWPMGNRIVDSAMSGIDKKEVQAAVQQYFVENDTAKPIRTRAVVVLYKGQLIAEQYGEGFSANTKLLGWSMTKSVTNTLIGMLVKDGKLQVDAPAPVPEWKDANDPRHAITLKNLLNQASGLDFVEDYSKASDATRMLFGRADMGGYTASHPLKDKPGSVFYYSSGNSNILSRIIRQTVGDANYYRFPYDSLFYKLGMYSIILEPDPSGTFVGSSYSYATARDWARFGLLYLNDGVWNGQRILPEGWVTATATPGAAAKEGDYGYQFWLNRGPANNPSNRNFPSCPQDLFYSDGFEGQFVYIIPSKHLVVVRLGLTKFHNMEEDGLLAGIVKAVK